MSLKRGVTTSSHSRVSWLLIFAVISVLALILHQSERLGSIESVFAMVLEPVQRGLTTITDGGRDVVLTLRDLHQLREENNRLRQQVADLTVDRVRYSEIERENQRLRRLLRFAQIHPSYDYRGGQVIARVIGHEPSNFLDYIMIDLGKRDGVVTGMPVVTEQGLVGRITEVYATSSKILLLTDPKSAVNALIQTSRVAGIIRGRVNANPIMDEIPQDAQVNVGDI
ncbi:MAG TPA: rod shape-determining protein MreC, partial [Anaerolineae bacterium]|nr:rod shape-determining protein MreC [Anaerolineae bacterium]